MVIWPVCHAAVTAENAAHVEDTHMQSYTCIAMHRSRGQGLLEAALTQGSFTPEEVRSIACGLTASAVCCSPATPGSAAPCPNQGIAGVPQPQRSGNPNGDEAETE